MSSDQDQTITAADAAAQARQWAADLREQADDITRTYENIDLQSVNEAIGYFNQTLREACTWAEGIADAFPDLYLDDVGGFTEIEEMELELPNTDKEIAVFDDLVSDLDDLEKAKE